MANIIGLNNDYSIHQPSTLKEELTRKVHQSMSVSGVVRRAWYADKWQVTMMFTGVNLQDYNYITQYIYNGANPVTYSNAATGVSFTGFVTAGVDVFIPGASFLRNLTITIQQE